MDILSVAGSGSNFNNNATLQSAWRERDPSDPDSLYELVLHFDDGRQLRISVPGSGEVSSPGWAFVESLTGISASDVAAGWTNDDEHGPQNAALDKVEGWFQRNLVGVSVPLDEHGGIDPEAVRALLEDPEHNLGALWHFLDGGPETPVQVQPGDMTKLFADEHEFEAICRAAGDEEIEIPVSKSGPDGTTLPMVALRLTGPEAHEQAEALVGRMVSLGGTPAMIVAKGVAYVVAKIPPITLTEENRDDISVRLNEFRARVMSGITSDGVAIDVLGLEGSIVISSNVRVTSAYVAQPMPKMSAFLEKPLLTLGDKIHKRVHELMDKSINGRLARLFQGHGMIGVDASGQEIKRTPEAYDTAFAKLMLKQLKGNVTTDELATAVWLRRGKAVSRRYLYELVSTIMQEAKPDDATAVSQSLLPDTLASRLWPLYYRKGKNGPVKATGVPLSEKARIILRWLREKNAKFYRYNDTKDIVFVIDGAQYTVCLEDPKFRDWIAREVDLFGPDDARAVELAAAINVAIQRLDDCTDIGGAGWGELNFETSTLSMCLDPDGEHTVRVRPAENGKPLIDVVENGIDGLAFRCPTVRQRRFKYHPGSVGWKRFLEVIHEYQALDETDRLASTSYNLATLIPGHIVRPIKCNQGPPGSGKTSAAKNWEYIVNSRNRTGALDLTTIWTGLASGGPVTNHDNAEPEIRRPFKNDYLLAATGGDKTVRKYYTNSDEVVYKPKGSLVVTAVEGFTAEEELQRSLEFFFSKAHHKAHGLTETERAQILEAESDKMLSGILEELSRQVLPNYSVRVIDAERYIRNQRPNHAKQRMNSFLAVMLLMFETLGGTRDEFLEWLDRQTGIQQEAAAESNQCVAYLDAIRRRAIEAWTRSLKPNAAFLVHRIPARVDRDGRVEIGPATTSALHAAFKTEARDMGLYGHQQPFESARGLGQRMSSATKSGVLADAGWERRPAGKASRNALRYKFVWRNTETSTGTGVSNVVDIHSNDQAVDAVDDVTDDGSDSEAV